MHKQSGAIRWQNLMKPGRHAENEEFMLRLPYVSTLGAVLLGIAAAVSIALFCVFVEIVRTSPLAMSEKILDLREAGGVRQTGYSAPTIPTLRLPAPTVSPSVKRLSTEGARPGALRPPLGGVGPRAKVVLIVDDLGGDRASFDAVMALPGPMTMSFLPYGQFVQEQADKARAAGHGVMLHLPMEPQGRADPGPNALWESLADQDIRDLVALNLTRFDGYTGLNNHMGSQFTENRAATDIAMAGMRGRISYFVDSVTTPHSVAADAARSAGIPAYRRDIFLDPAPGEIPVYQSLSELEAIARKEGVVIAILHPREATLSVLGAWLASAPARGFELITMDDYHASQTNRRIAMIR